MNHLVVKQYAKNKNKPYLDQNPKDGYINQQRKHTSNDPKVLHV